MKLEIYLCFDKTWWTGPDRTGTGVVESVQGVTTKHAALFSVQRNVRRQGVTPVLALF